MEATPLDVQAKNAKAVQRSIDALAKVLGAIEVGGKLGLADVGVEFRNAVVRLLSSAGTGRTYRRGRVFHRASAPGRPPAVDTGKYRASWNYQVGEDSQGPYVDIGTNDKRGPWFEYGTRRMKPRPHARVAANQLRAQITRMVKTAIENEQKAEIGRLPKEITG